MNFFTNFFSFLNRKSETIRIQKGFISTLRSELRESKEYTDLLELTHEQDTAMIDALLRIIAKNHNNRNQINKPCLN